MLLPAPRSIALGLVERIVPGERLERRCPARRPRVDDPVVGAQMGEAEAALVAEPALVDLGVVARHDRASPCPRASSHSTLQPTGQRPQTVGTSWISQGRASKRYCVEVSAPTGQSSITFPEKGARYGSSSKVAMIDCAPRSRATSWLSSATSSREARAAVAEDAALPVERDRRRDRDRLFERALRERVPGDRWAPAERQILERALAALVADGAVERVVDEDELERGVLALGRVRRRLRGADDHAVLRGQRAAGLKLRHALDLDEAHAAGADGRSEPRLVAEDGDLDPGRERGLDEPGSLRRPRPRARRS